MKGRLLSAVNSPWAAYACLLIAVANRVINIFFVSYAGRDKMALVLQSKNFLLGKGLSIPQYFINNTETAFLNSTPLWPPGYPLLLAPILKLFNYDVYLATTSFDIIVSLVFIFLMRSIAKQLHFPVAAVNAVTLIAGCFEYPFIHESLPTDTVSLDFFLLGLLFVLKITGAPGVSVFRCLLAGILLFLPCMFRYAYPPVALSVPAVIIITALIQKNKGLLKKGILILLATVVVMAVFFISLKIMTGAAGYITPTERGYFPENIKHWYPVVPGSFIDLPFLTSQLIKITGRSFEKIMYILEMMNVFFVLVFTGIFFYLLAAKKYFRNPDSFRWFILLGSAATAATIAVLGYLSFTFQVQKGIVNNWNYISEARYFALPFVFIQLVFTGWFFLPGVWKRGWFKKTAAFIFAALLLTGILHSIYFHTKVAFRFRQYKEAVFREQDYNYFIALLSTLKKENPDHEILVAAPGDNFYTYTASYYNHKGIFDGSNLRSVLPVVKSPSFLLVMLYDSEKEAYRDFFRHSGVRHIRQIAYSGFYLCELYP